MRDEDAGEFAKALAAQGVIYPKRGITDDLAEIYFSVLSDYELHEVLAAFKAHNLDPVAGPFFPKPADLVKHLDTNKPRKMEVRDRACLAWGALMGAIQDIGPYRTLKLEDQQAIAAVKHLGGWKKICEATHAQLVWLEKDFFAAYDTYENAPLEYLPKTLPGLPELMRVKRAKTIFLEAQ